MRSYNPQTLSHTVKVQSGPGTSGYDKMTPKQRAVKQNWAKFATYQDAENFASVTRHLHSTWIVTVETK